MEDTGISKGCRGGRDNTPKKPFFVPNFFGASKRAHKSMAPSRVRHRSPHVLRGFYPIVSQFDYTIFFRFCQGAFEGRRIRRRSGAGRMGTHRRPCRRKRARACGAAYVRSRIFSFCAALPRRGAGGSRASARPCRQRADSFRREARNRHIQSASPTGACIRSFVFEFLEAWWRSFPWFLITVSATCGRFNQASARFGGRPLYRDVSSFDEKCHNILQN